MRLKRIQFLELGHNSRNLVYQRSTRYLSKGLSTFFLRQLLCVLLCFGGPCSEAKYKTGPRIMQMSGAIAHTIKCHVVCDIEYARAQFLT